MDSLQLLLDGFATAIQPQYLAFAFLGVFNRIEVVDPPYMPP